MNRTIVPGIDSEPYLFSWDALPTVTTTAGTGGVIRSQPQHFHVEELPAYEPSGTGSHLYLLIEKRNLTTANVVSELVQRGVDERDVGVAGLKDKNAVTVQWISVPKNMQNAAMDLATVAGIEIIDASYHKNKLAIGHLLGNRFRIRIQGVEQTAHAQAVQTLQQLQAGGVANYFGPQRFGSFGRNAYDGYALVKGHDVPGGDRMHRFFVSALQSHVFNHLLAERVRGGYLNTVIDGDWAKKHDTGGEFEILDAASEQERAERNEISATIPLHGQKVPVSQRAAGERERAMLARFGLQWEDFSNRNGDRRLSRIFITNVGASMHEGDLVIAFDLPKGSFATTIIREVTKLPVDAPVDD